MPELKVCVETKDFWLDGKRLNLAKRLTDALLLLASRRGYTASIEALMHDAEFDISVQDDRHAMYNIISRLRRILGKGIIVSRDGVGYYLSVSILFVKIGDLEGGDHDSPNQCDT